VSAKVAGREFGFRVQPLGCHPETTKLKLELSTHSNLRACGDDTYNPNVELRRIGVVG
jgi:hypothetical protein